MAKYRCKWGRLVRPVRTSRGGMRRCKLPPRRRKKPRRYYARRPDTRMYVDPAREAYVMAKIQAEAEREEQQHAYNESFVSGAGLGRARRRWR